MQSLRAEGFHRIAKQIPKPQEDVKQAAYRRRLDWIGAQLGIQIQSDWYSISRENLQAFGGVALLNNHFNGSLYNALSILYPEYVWHPEAFFSPPHHFWKDLRNQRQLMDWIAEQLNVHKHEDWYRVTAKDVNSIGLGLLQRYEGCLSSALESIYPEFKWNPLRFTCMPKYLQIEKKQKGRRDLMDWIGEQLGIQQQSDWYAVTAEQIDRVGNGLLSKHYQGSVLKALRSVYSEFIWNPLLFHIRIPKTNPKNGSLHRELMDWVGEQLGVEQQSDWYSVTKAQVCELGAEVILNNYPGNSLFNALQSIYPEYEWDPLYLTRSSAESAGSTTTTSPSSASSSVTALSNTKILWRKRMDWLAEQLQIDVQEDWYRVTSADVLKLGASTFLVEHFNGSLFTALSTVYEEYDWNPLLCAHPPHNLFSKYGHRFFTQLLESFTHSVLETQQLSAINSREFRLISKRFGGKLKTLQLFFPQQAALLRSTKYDSEGEYRLEMALKSRYDAVERHKIINGHNVDFYLPLQSIAIEFQGGQHYSQTHRGSFSLQMERDNLKQRELRALGINLIQIPYWWHGDSNSLFATIDSHLHHSLQHSQHSSATHHSHLLAEAQ